MYIFMHQTVTTHDAIGNDIAHMYHILEKRDKCVVYATNKFNNTLEYIEKDELQRCIKNSGNVLIYHHSVFWEEGEQILEESKCKIIFKYHNITPPIFFRNDSFWHYVQCSEGREQTDRLVEKFPNAFWLADSYYNAEDLQNVPAERLAICPPFHNIEMWTRAVPDESILSKLLNSDEINLLFVGRVVPNKGHLFLLNVLRIFMLNYGRKVRLRIVGKMDDSLQKYNALIRSKIFEMGLSENIEFIGEINDETLLAYYLGSDFYVNASEHEGFCVPVIESQYLGLPIISLKSTAVPETMGKNQMLLDEDYAQFAAAIKLIYDNDEYYQGLVESGMKNYSERFTYQKISDCFNECMRKAER